MTEQNFDAFTRRAAEGVSRRKSLVALGGATLAAIAAKPSIADAKQNSGKNANKKAKKKARKKCKKQVGQCNAFVMQMCARSRSPQQCQSDNLRCCESFATCNAGAALQCFSPPENSQ